MVGGSFSFSCLFVFSFICHCARTRAGVALSRFGLPPASVAAMVRGEKASAIWCALRVGEGLSGLVLIGWRLVPREPPRSKQRVRNLVQLRLSVGFRVSYSTATHEWNEPGSHSCERSSFDPRRGMCLDSKVVRPDGYSSTDAGSHAATGHTTGSRAAAAVPTGSRQRRRARNPIATKS